MSPLLPWKKKWWKRLVGRRLFITRAVIENPTMAALPLPPPLKRPYYPPLLSKMTYIHVTFGISHSEDMLLGLITFGSLIIYIFTKESTYSLSICMNLVTELKLTEWLKRLLLWKFRTQQYLSLWSEINTVMVVRELENQEWGLVWYK